MGMIMSVTLAKISDQEQSTRAGEQHPEPSALDGLPVNTIGLDSNCTDTLRTVFQVLADPSCVVVSPYGAETLGEYSL